VAPGTRIDDHCIEKRLNVPAGRRDVSAVNQRVADVPEQQTNTLTCGCVVETGRDFLGRGIGTIVARGESCPRADHVPGHIVLLPGRAHAGETS